MKSISYKHNNERITTRGNGNVLSHPQEQIPLSSTVVLMHSTTIVNSGAHAQYHYRQQWCSCIYRWKIIKSSCNKINLATNTNKLKSIKDPINRTCQIGTMLTM